MPTAVRSHAKINLGLGIGAPRPDGFHGLTTVYQTLELHDVVTVTARPAAATAIRLTSNDGRVPDGQPQYRLEDGGAGAEDAGRHSRSGDPYREAAAGAGRAGRGLGQCGGGAGGAGGGAGNLEIRASHPSAKARGTGAPGDGVGHVERLEIAAQVGSDVPLFLIGGTVLGLDRGQEVYPLPDIEPVWCVVAAPEMGVSTPRPFATGTRSALAEGLTAEASTDKLNELSRAYASAFREQFREGRAGSRLLRCPLCNEWPEDLAGPQESALVRTGIT